MILVNRIYKALDQDLKLIYFLKIKNNFLFFILGTSGFIYTIKIQKDLQTCNCVDYINGFYCKHINFILFKVLKIFKIMKNNEIKFIYENSLLKTSFQNNLQFEEIEWTRFNNKFNKIYYFLKNSYFNKKDYYKFDNIYKKYTSFFHTFQSKIEKGCVICLNNDFNLIICPRCKNTYHQSCLIKWFESLNHDKICPICKDDSWKEIMKYILIDSEYMFKLDYFN